MFDKALFLFYFIFYYLIYFIFNFYYFIKLNIIILLFYFIMIWEREPVRDGIAALANEEML